LKENLPKTIAFLGIGSNLSDPAKQCLTAIKRISTLDHVRLLKSSSLYKTEPVGITEQDWFVNAAIEIRTTLGPLALLKALTELECAMGRLREEKWGPRIIDLDILFYGQEIINEGGLVVPHPELHRSRFVMIPLVEIASYVVHPLFGVSIRGLLGRLEDRSRVMLLED
jgi:2-amino-4-hydroxy-6-hydroxymethyldihydropteridine diphosphokinase